MEARSGYGDRDGGRGGGYMQRDRDDNEPLKSDENSWRRAPEPEPEVSYPYQSKPSSDRYQSSDRRGGTPIFRYIY